MEYYDKQVNNKVKTFCKNEMVNELTIFIDTTRGTNAVFAARLENKILKQSFIRSIRHSGLAFEAALDLIDTLDARKEFIVFVNTPDGFDKVKVNNLDFLNSVNFKDDQFGEIFSILTKFNNELNIKGEM